MALQLGFGPSTGPSPRDLCGIIATCLFDPYTLPNITKEYCVTECGLCGQVIGVMMHCHGSMFHFNSRFHVQVRNIGLNVKVQRAWSIWHTLGNAARGSIAVQIFSIQKNSEFAPRRGRGCCAFLLTWLLYYFINYTISDDEKRFSYLITRQRQPWRLPLLADPRCVLK